MAVPLLSGLSGAVYYAYYYRKNCGQVPEIFGGEGEFLSLLREHCPILKEEYRPPPLVHESRILTVLGLYRHRSLNYPYMREVFETVDGAVINLDWWDIRLQPKSPAEIPVTNIATSVVDYLSHYYTTLTSRGLSHLLVPYFGTLKRTISAPVMAIGHLQELAAETEAPNVRFRPLSTLEELQSDRTEEKPKNRTSSERLLESLPEPKGIVLIMPGMTGDSSRNYVQGLVQAIEELGFTAVVMNFRGATGNLRACFMAETTDVAQVVRHIKERYPKVPILAVGVSMGGILLSNYVARCGMVGEDSRLLALMTISMPWNAFETAKSLEEPLNWFIFNRTLTNNMRDAVKQNSDILEQAYDLKGLNKVRTLREYDNHLTAKMFGFETADEWYQASTLHDKVIHMKTPTLAINAADDVFSPYTSIPKEDAMQNPNLAIVVTAHGGHIGFQEALNPFGINYTERVVKQFATAVFSHQVAVEAMAHHDNSAAVTHGQDVLVRSNQTPTGSRRSSQCSLQSQQSKSAATFVNTESSKVS